MRTVDARHDRHCTYDRSASTRTSRSTRTTRPRCPLGGCCISNWATTAARRRTSARPCSSCDTTPWDPTGLAPAGNDEHVSRVVTSSRHHPFDFKAHTPSCTTSRRAPVRVSGPAGSLPIRPGTPSSRKPNRGGARHSLPGHLAAPTPLQEWARAVTPAGRSVSPLGVSWEDRSLASSSRTVRFAGIASLSGARKPTPSAAAAHRITRPEPAKRNERRKQ